MDGTGEGVGVADRVAGGWVVTGEGVPVSGAAGVSLGHSGSGVGAANRSQAESNAPMQISTAYASQALALNFRFILRINPYTNRIPVNQTSQVFKTCEVFLMKSSVSCLH